MISKFKNKEAALPGFLLPLAPVGCGMALGPWFLRKCAVTQSSRFILSSSSWTGNNARLHQMNTGLLMHLLSWPWLAHNLGRLASGLWSSWLL